MDRKCIFNLATRSNSRFIRMSKIDKRFAAVVDVSKSRFLGQQEVDSFAEACERATLSYELQLQVEV